MRRTTQTGPPRGRGGGVRQYGLTRGEQNMLKPGVLNESGQLRLERGGEQQMFLSCAFFLSTQPFMNIYMTCYTSNES